MSSSVSSSTGSGAFSIGSLISNLDTESMITALTTYASQAVTDLQTQKTSLTNKLTAWSDLNSRLLALQTAAESLDSSSSFQAKTVSSNNSDIVTATALSTADLTTHSFKVVSLAQANQIISQGFAGQYSTLGTGDFTITVNGTSHTITVDSGNNNLSALAAAINAADAGVTASVLNTGESGTPYKLVLNSHTYGEAGEINIESNLSGGSEPSFIDLQAAQDAHIKIGEQDIYRSSNTITDIFTGITLSLKKADENTTVTLSVAANSNSVKNSVNALLTAYNNSNSFFSDQFAYDATTGTEGTLFGNSTLMAIQDRIYSKITDYVSGSGSIHNLSAIGITADANGNFSITDETAFSEAVENNNADLVKLFTDSQDGLAVRIKSYLSDVLAPSTGMVSSTEDYVQDQIDDVSDRITSKQEYVDRMIEYYTKQFNKLETALAALKSQSDYISEQVSMLNSGWSWNNNS